MENYVKIEMSEWGALIIIDRPKALNALNSEVLQQLRNRLQECETYGAKVVILTGSGDKAFVAGADITAMKDMDPKEAYQFSLAGQKVFSSIADMKAVVIAAVNGYALGGGCELAMACDFRIASENARFGIPEVSLGVIPGFGATQRLSRIVGTGKAMEMLATAEQITAEEALRYGLVNRVVKKDQLLSECIELAKKIGRNSSAAIAMGKQSILCGKEVWSCQY